MPILIYHMKKAFFSLVFISFCSVSIAKTTAQWFEASRFGDTWTLSSMMFAGTDINTRDERGNTALHQALVEPSPAAVAWLIRQPGIDLNARNGVGETALMQAIIHGHSEIAQILLRAGAAVNQTGWTPLHYAAASKKPDSPKFVRLLLEQYSAYIDAESPNGTTPLMMAARYGLTESVNVLIEAGADLEVKNKQGLTALEFARSSEHPDSTKLVEAAFAKLALEQALARAQAQASAKPTEPPLEPAAVTPVIGGNQSLEFETIPKGQW